MKKDFDIIVIGAGAGGLNIAGFCNRIGLSTLLIDKTDRNIGGDCLNYGCVPSKALIHAARTIQSARQATQFGVRTEGAVDMHKVREYILHSKDTIRTHENAEYFREKGMTVVLGEAKFSGKHSVRVGNEEFTGSKIVIATGSRPRELVIPGSDRVRVYTNETIFDIEQLPKRLVVIGGGPIGVEIGQAFAYLGSQVTIISSSMQLLPREDKEVADILAKQLEKDGVAIKFGYSAERFASENTLVVRGPQHQTLSQTASPQEYQEESIEFDAVFSAIGRETNVLQLDAEKADIHLTSDKRQLEVNAFLQTTNAHVFVCGDAAGTAQFTHEAERHASVILNNFFSPFKKKLDSTTLAWSTFTFPEVATFGQNEQELKQAGIAYEVCADTFKDDDRAIIDHYPQSLAKIFIAKGKIVGGIMIAPLASEIVQELILAQNAKIPVDMLFKKTYPYPTATRINKRIISSYQSKKLTQFGMRLLRMLFH